jgi:hypothetical protein
LIKFSTQLLCDDLYKALRLPRTSDLKRFVDTAELRIAG